MGHRGQERPAPIILVVLFLFKHNWISWISRLTCRKIYRPRPTLTRNWSRCECTSIAAVSYGYYGNVVAV